MAVGIGASAPLCLPDLHWNSIVPQLSDVHWGTCSSVLQTHEVSALCLSMAGLEARILCYFCLKKSLPVLFCSYIILDFEGCVCSVSLTP